MNRDIGLTPYLFGWGAGIFFFGYFIFEIPSNMMMARVGARKWIARILFTWGVLACAMALVTGPVSFIVLRFQLGITEAGFFPGVILYLSYWFPVRYRARIEVAPFGRTVFSIFKWNAGRSRCRFHRGQHREVSFIRGLVRQT
jgi:ACS family tartrate transporter-like MFS transporter